MTNINRILRINVICVLENDLSPASVIAVAEKWGIHGAAIDSKRNCFAIRKMLV